jgi:hypothetical protein
VLCRRRPPDIKATTPTSGVARYRDWIPGTARIIHAVLDAGWLPAVPACVTDPAKIYGSVIPAPSSMTASGTFKHTFKPLTS